jgi:hypothetical protein
MGRSSPLGCQTAPAFIATGSCRRLKCREQDSRNKQSQFNQVYFLSSGKKMITDTEPAKHRCSCCDKGEHIMPRRRESYMTCDCSRRKCHICKKCFVHCLCYGLSPLHSQAYALIVECNEYLLPNKLNSICSTSILHQKMQDLIKRVEAVSE